MEADLKTLEEKIGQLVELARRLRSDNRDLRQELAQAVSDNKRLGEKVDAARARLEALLDRLPEDV
jgi:cell division protein ZapB